jgi:hypothetical protein
LALVGTGLASGLAALATPLGLGMLPYLLLMTRHPNQATVLDFMHPTLDDPVNKLFYATILALLVTFAVSRRRPRASDLIAVCGLLWLAWTMQRSVTWFAMLAGPLLVHHLSRPETVRPATLTTPRPRLNKIILGTLLVPLLIAQPWLISRVPLPEALRARVHETTAYGPLLAADTPIGAVEYLRRQPGGRLFNEQGYGSYLAWALPQQPAFFLPFFEAFPPSLIDDYVAISHGREVTVRLARYDVDRVLLSLTEQPALSRALAASSAWQREYADEHSEVWRRLN